MAGETLENTVEKQNEHWIKRAFRQEWPTMGNHLASAAIAIGAATGFSHVAPKIMESDALISGLATAIDSGSYWAAFLPQLLYRDRKKLRNENGNLDRKKVSKKLVEYLGYIGAIEAAYTTIRFTGQYLLQKEGWDPAAASASIQLGATAFFTAAWPLIRYGTRQWSEREK